MTADILQFPTNDLPSRQDVNDGFAEILAKNRGLRSEPSFEPNTRSYLRSMVIHEGKRYEGIPPIYGQAEAVTVELAIAGLLQNYSDVPGICYDLPATRELHVPREPKRTKLDVMAGKVAIWLYKDGTWFVAESDGPSKDGSPLDGVELDPVTALESLVYNYRFSDGELALIEDPRAIGLE